MIYMEYCGRIKIIYLYQPGRPWVNGHRSKIKNIHGVILSNSTHLGTRLENLRMLKSQFSMRWKSSMFLVFTFLFSLPPKASNMIIIQHHSINLFPKISPFPSLIFKSSIICFLTRIYFSRNIIWILSRCANSRVLAIVQLEQLVKILF